MFYLNLYHIHKNRNSLENHFVIHSLQAEIYNGNSEISNLDMFPHIYIEDDAVRKQAGIMQCAAERKMKM